MESAISLKGKLIMSENIRTKTKRPIVRSRLVQMPNTKILSKAF